MVSAASQGGLISLVDRFFRGDRLGDFIIILAFGFFPLFAQA